MLCRARVVDQPPLLPARTPPPPHHQGVSAANRWKTANTKLGGVGAVAACAASRGRSSSETAAPGAAPQPPGRRLRSGSVVGSIKSMQAALGLSQCASTPEEGGS